MRRLDAGRLRIGIDKRRGSKARAQYGKRKVLGKGGGGTN
jgi:hypothetical protein